MTYLLIKEDGFIYGYHTQFIDGALETNIDPTWLHEHTGKLYLKDGVYYIKQQQPVDRSRLLELHALLSNTDWKVIVNNELKALGQPAKYDEQQLHDTRQAWRDEINALEQQVAQVEWLEVTPIEPEPEIIEEVVDDMVEQVVDDILPIQEQTNYTYEEIEAAKLVETEEVVESDSTVEDTETEITE